MTTALSFAEHVLWIFVYLFVAAGVVAALMYATGLTQQRTKPRHRAGDPPPGWGAWSDDCIICSGEVTDIDDLPPDLADKALRSMRECEADAAVRLRRELEECDD